MTNEHLTPHDRFFRSLMANQKVAREFFETHLPVNIKNIVDLSKLQLQHDSYIGDNLREKIVDLLYKANFSGTDGYIYILVEHQSEPQKLMPFRILKYMIAIMEDHLKNTHGNTLPIVYPMIFYSGAKPYNYSTDLLDLFERRELAAEILWRPYKLIDLSKVTAEQIDQLLWYGALAEVMKYVHKYRKNMLPLLKQMMGKLQKIENFGDLSYIYTTITYFFTTGEIPNEEEFREVIQQGLTKSGDKIMSYADVLMNRGYQRGVAETMSLAELLKVEVKAEGKAEGKAEAAQDVAVKLLRRNLDLGIIADGTGLSLAQILELKKKVEN